MQNAIAYAKAFCYRCNMDAKTFIDEFGRDEAKRIAECAGTTIEYFSQIAHGHRRPSVKLAKRLVVSSESRLSFIALLDSIDDEQKEAA